MDQQLRERRIAALDQRAKRLEQNAGIALERATNEDEEDMARGYAEQARVLRQEIDRLKQTAP